MNDGDFDETEDMIRGSDPPEAFDDTTDAPPTPIELFAPNAKPKRRGRPRGDAFERLPSLEAKITLRRNLRVEAAQAEAREALRLATARACMELFAPLFETCHAVGWWQMFDLEQGAVLLSELYTTQIVQVEGDQSMDQTPEIWALYTGPALAQLEAVRQRPSVKTRLGSAFGVNVYVIVTKETAYSFPVPAE